MTMISIIVNFFNNTREADRTLYTLSRLYQANVHDVEYEVIAIDHGSLLPLQEERLSVFGPEIKYKYIATNAKSPVVAINRFALECAGDFLVIMIDGAHMLSPGMLRAMVDARQAYRNCFIASCGLHIGPKQQNISHQEGYDQATEDEILKSIDWQCNGYELYNVSVDFHDSTAGWFGCPYESNCFGISRSEYLAVGGFDERFSSPGAGLANLDIFQRIVVKKNLDYIYLLGEATFHQFHGGVASNAPVHDHPWDRLHAEYVEIRGKSLDRIWRRPIHFGKIPYQAIKHHQRSAIEGIQHWLNAAAYGVEIIG